MRVLMLGWEFPPNKSGGLGTACYGITRALLNKGTDVIFVMPQTDLTEHPISHVKLRSASGTLVPELYDETEAVEENTVDEVSAEELESILRGRSVPAAGSPKADLSTGSRKYTIEELNRFTSHMVMHGIRTSLMAYDTAQSYEERLTKIVESARHRVAEGGAGGGFVLPEELAGLPMLEKFNELFQPEMKNKTRMATKQKVRWNRISLHGGYGSDLMSEIWRYSLAAVQIALKEEFDVIHVHDWMTYPAGILLKQVTGKPLVAHIHALEHDRSGEGVNSTVAHIEWAGMNAADRVVAVSWYTKNEVMRLYQIPGEKIEVVHNAVDRTESATAYNVKATPHRYKRVLFMSRITYQKGPDYFVEAARLVHERMPDVHFVMAGSGDMFYRMVRRVSQLRMGTVFHFPGFQTGANVERMYANCDLYVMPSVSEPFGIAPLEAMICDIPVIISRQSGVAEVVQNALKVDFWDIHEMANKICSVLSYPELAASMVKNSREDLRRIRWSTAATHLNRIYRECLDRR